MAGRGAKLEAVEPALSSVGTSEGQGIHPALV